MRVTMMQTNIGCSSCDIGLVADCACSDFLTENGQGLTRQSFCSALNSVLSQLPVNTSLYKSHSFCIGAATTSAKVNIPDVYIKML